MLLASYKSTRPGWQGVANVLIRIRLNGQLSHNEIVFEPGDGVDGWMPDGTCAPDADGALWCVSSVAAERLPASSRRRAGKIGGVRFKRIKLDSAKWDLVPSDRSPLYAVATALELEGSPYDWQLIASFLSWLIHGKDGRETCSGFCARALGIPDPERLDPCSLRAVVAWGADRNGG